MSTATLIRVFVLVAKSRFWTFFDKEHTFFMQQLKAIKLIFFILEKNNISTTLLTTAISSDFELYRIREIIRDS